MFRIIEIRFSVFLLGAIFVQGRRDANKTFFDELLGDGME
jgi:hypothetical protein